MWSVGRGRGEVPSVSIYGGLPCTPGDFPGGSVGKASVCNAGDLIQSLGLEDSLEKEMATHSNTLA